MKNSLASILLIVLLVIGLSVGYFGGVSNAPTSTSTALSTTTRTETSATTTTVTQSATTTVQGQNNVVNLVVIPDFGGTGYDAFVKAGNFNATAPKLATGTTKPGPNNNNMTVPAGVPIKFVITNIDTAVVQNFTGSVTTPFSIYNDTANGQVGVQYQPSQKITNLAISHTFTIAALNMNIPIPPDTIVVFTYVFSKPGIYQFLCLTPCGPGMAALGYMYGYIIVK